MDFKPIETQEQFNTMIAERLKREREAVEKKFEGYLSPEEIDKKYQGYMSQEDVDKKYQGYLSPEEVAKKDAEIKRYESDSVKTRIAGECGLPIEIAQRLQGSDEDSLRKDAQELAKVFGNAKKVVAPLKSTEVYQEDAKTKALRSMVEGLTEKE